MSKKRSFFLELNATCVYTIFGENSRAISTLTQLLQMPYNALIYDQTPITPVGSNLGSVALRSALSETLRRKARGGRGITLLAS
jgi:hypothetical protein